MKFDPTRPFDLPLLPPELNFKHEQFVDVMLKTRTELGELNGYSYSLPNPLLLWSPAVIKESVASSNIENINTTMEEIYDLLGSEVTSLVNGILSPGSYAIPWNASHFASGIYFYRLEGTSTSDPAKTFTQMKKMVLIK